MEEKMKLNDEEKVAVEKYQMEIKNTMAAVGSVRRQALKSEQELIQRLDNLENEFLNHLRALAKKREMPDDEDWVFDPNTYGFVKKE